MSMAVVPIVPGTSNAVPASGSAAEGKSFQSVFGQTMAEADSRQSQYPISQKKDPHPKAEAAVSASAHPAHAKPASSKGVEATHDGDQAAKAEPKRNAKPAEANPRETQEAAESHTPGEARAKSSAESEQEPEEVAASSEAPRDQDSDDKDSDSDVVQDGVLSDALATLAGSAVATRQETAPSGEADETVSTGSEDSVSAISAGASGEKAASGVASGQASSVGGQAQSAEAAAEPVSSLPDVTAAQASADPAIDTKNDTRSEPKAAASDAKVEAPGLEVKAAQDSAPQSNKQDWLQQAERLWGIWRRSNTGPAANAVTARPVANGLEGQTSDGAQRREEVASDKAAFNRGDEGAGETADSAFTAVKIATAPGKAQPEADFVAALKAQPSASADVSMQNTAPNTAEAAVAAGVGGAATGPEPRAETIAQTVPNAEPKSPPPPGVGRQIGEGVRVAFLQGGDRVTIQLKPESLGRVHVSLVREPEGLAATIRVESSEARAALVSQVAEMKESFAQKGIHLVNVEVAMDDRSAESRNGDPRRRGRQRGRGADYEIETVRTEEKMSWRPWGFETRV
jgi:flagellar hook-length control protein FliK